MEVFGIIGMSFGTVGFVFSLSALAQIAKLEKRLKEAGVFEVATPQRNQGDPP